jgi:hypothetical protein
MIHLIKQQLGMIIAMVVLSIVLKMKKYVLVFINLKIQKNMFIYFSIHLQLMNYFFYNSPIVKSTPLQNLTQPKPPNNNGHKIKQL